MNAKFIGGVKHETIVGAETKTNFVTKAEIIKGATFKSHVGPEYKHEKSKKVEKNPSLLEQIKAAKAFYGDYYRQVRGDCLTKGAKKKRDQADRHELEGKNWIGDFEAEMKRKCKTLREEAEKKEEKITKIQQTCEKVQMACNLTVNNATFTVKKGG
jgi:hypothetical protein